jgi:hypothetical protein
MYYRQHQACSKRIFIGCVGAVYTSPTYKHQEKQQQQQIKKVRLT